MVPVMVMVSVMVSVTESKVGLCVSLGALNCLFDDCVMVMVMVMVSITIDHNTDRRTETITEGITITRNTQLLQCLLDFTYIVPEYLHCICMIINWKIKILLYSKYCV